MLDWISKGLTKDEFIQEVAKHPLLLLGPDDGAFPYADEAVEPLTNYIKWKFGVDIKIYSGYLDKTRESGTKVTIPGYILGKNGKKIKTIKGINVNECWTMVLDDETSHGSTLLAAVYALRRKIGFSWQRVLPGIVDGKLARGMKPFETGWNEEEIKIAKEPKSEYINEKKELMAPRILFSTKAVALPSDFPQEQKVSIGPVVSYAVRRIQGIEDEVETHSLAKSEQKNTGVIDP